jgi:tetratricopeptide (TPR) repeat protein/lysophospholipase L1-like esterase
MPSGTHRFLFRLISALFPFVVLLLAEISLRLFAPSLNSPFTREAAVDTVRMLQVNRSYLERYFPANAPMVPELKPSLLRAQKGKRAIRVFCVGESSMFGTPYELCATIPALVRKQLRHLFPEEDVEVVNFGASAINSNVIADLAPLLAQLDPDVVLLYLGHNEFYGPDGVGAPWIEKRFPFLTRLKYRARSLRIVRLAQKGLASFGRPAQDGERNLMKQVSRGATVVSGSPEEERVLDRFGENLRIIIRTFRERGIRVVASDVTSNLMFPPFITGPRHDEIPPLLSSGKAADALRQLQSLKRTDTANAFIDYWLGRTRLALGDTAEARRSLGRARDEDLLKFRAPARTDSIIHDVCRSEGVPCIAVDSLFASLCAGGIPGWTLFWEHLHPNVRGYDIISREFVRELLAIVPPQSNTGLLPFDAGSLDLSWLDLAYGELSVRALTGRWPFTDFTSPSPVLNSGDATERGIVNDIYVKKIGWTDACLRYAAYEENAGRVQEALRTYGALIDEYPFEFYPRYRRAALLRDAGDIPRAAAEYRRVIALNGAYPYALIDLGLLLNNAGEFDEARERLSRALQLTEGQNLPLPRAQILYGLAAISANTGDTKKALEMLGTSIRLSPSYAPAQQLRKQILAHTR